MTTSTKIESQETHQSLLRNISQAHQLYEESRVEISNRMADIIIENGGVTANIDEFALAMHGISYVGYNREWLPNRVFPSQDNADRKIFDLYDDIEQSVRGVSPSIMMNEYVNDMFAMVPSKLLYPARNDNRAVSQPLRFTVKGKTHGSITKTYTGKILLPILEVGHEKQKEARPKVVRVASYRRRCDSLRGEEQDQYSDGFPDVWRIGKNAIIGSRIQDYRTSLHDDKKFLDRLDKATKILNDATTSHDEISWESVLHTA